MTSYIIIIRRFYYTVQLYNKSQFLCQSLKKEMFFSEIEIRGYCYQLGIQGDPDSRPYVVQFQTPSLKIQTNTGQLPNSTYRSIYIGVIYWHQDNSSHTYPCHLTPIGKPPWWT